MTTSVDAVLGEVGLGQALLAELRSLCPEMPDVGIVAGQSVASLILRRLGRPGPVNDIDVFVIRPLQRQWSEERRAMPRIVYAAIGQAARHERDPMGLGNHAHGGYGAALVYSHRAFYARIGQVSRNGLLNLIEYQVEAEEGCDALALITGHFDLNCVQVGIDLATARLSFTDAFREYLDTGQLILTSGNTPVSSLGRLVRKTQELGAYCDLETEGRFAAACAMLFGAGNDAKEAADFVGEIGYEKLEPHRAAIERWMHLAPVSAFTRIGRPADLDWPDERTAVAAEPPWRGEPFRLYRACLNPEVEQNLSERPSACEEILLEKESGRWVATLRGRPLSLLEFSVIDRIFRRGVLSRQKLEKLQLVFEHGQRGVLVGALAAPKSYVRDNVTVRSIDALNRFFGEHPEVATALVGISHEEQVRIVRELRREERRRNRWVVGAVETAHFWMNEPVGPAIVRDGLQAFMGRYRQQGKVLLEGSVPPGLERLPLFEIRRLTTPEALVTEGEEMGHCVGGYAPLLWSPGSFVFSIRFRLGWSARFRSTLLVRENAFVRWSEHRSVRNERPFLANTVAAGVLQERLRAAREDRRPQTWAVARTIFLREVADRLGESCGLRRRGLAARGPLGDLL
jgi:hypothetical protein